MSLPKHMLECYGSTRSFKTDKRRLLREIRKLANDFYAGSAFIPEAARKPAQQFRQSLKELEDLLSERKWGR